MIDPKSVLIAIFSGVDHLRYGARREMCRKTHLPILRKMGYDARFVFSETRPADFSEEDCVCLPGFPESYAALPLKTRAACQWAVSRPEIAVLVKSDDDCLILPDRLRAFLDALPPNVLYTGANVGTPVQEHLPPYASGGASYILRRPAFEIVAKSAMPQIGDEDVQVGRIMRENGIPFHPSRLFSPWPSFGIPDKDNSLIAGHALNPHQWWRSWQSCTGE